jgi:HD superfamily phosphohydrolase
VDEGWGDAVGVIRDSLYDRILIGSAERALIGSEPFLRLQELKQLGFVYRVWPGAVHTRFEHSLGVYHLATAAVRRLGARGDLARAGVGAAAARALVLAALLHDVGHYPYAHAVEEIGAPVPVHERVGRWRIEREPLATLLEQRGGVSPGVIADLIDPPAAGLAPPWDLLRQLLSGALDVDKLDYLPRDARACNVPYAGVDVPRLLASLCVVTEGPRARLGVDDKGISALHSLVHARQEMFDNVYWHHTNRAMMAMLLRAVQDALDGGALAPEALAAHDDHSLLTALAAPGMPPTTRALARDLRARRPYKIVLEVSDRAGVPFARLDALFWDQGRRRRLEQDLAGRLGRALGEAVADHELLVDIPKPEKWEMDVPVVFRDPPLGLEPVMDWTLATDQRPRDLARYERAQRRIRLVAAARLVDTLRGRRHDVVLPALLSSLDPAAG